MKIFAFLALLSAVHAIPLLIDQQIADLPYPVGSSDYLKEVLGGVVAKTNLMAAQVDVVSRLQNQGLQEAAKIAQRADLNKILAEAASYTLFAPNDQAVQNWKRKMADLKFHEGAQTKALEQLCKAWIVPKIVQATDIANEMVVQSIRGDWLKFNIYEQQQQPGDQILTAQSQKITANGAQIITIGQQANGGIIHVVDRVIFPLPKVSVIKTLAKVNRFSLFVDLVRHAGIEEELEADGITLFAPVNEALDQQLLAELMNDQTKAKLQKFLRYHAISGTSYSAGLSNGQRKRAADGKMIQINIENDKIYLNKDNPDTKAEILLRDIPATNGVLHIVDKVLRPPQQIHSLNFWF